MAIDQNKLEVCILFVICLLIFTWGLASQEIVGFESRFFLFAKEMWQAGFSWFPTTYFKPYPDYPVTSTFLTYLAAKIGGLNKLTAVLPSAISAAITVVITYLIGTLHNKRYGFYAVCFLLLTIGFLKGARSITLDMYTTMITTWCFYLIYSAEVMKKSQRLWWILPLLVVGFAFRGPIGLIIPAGVICTYYLLEKNVKKFFLLGSAALFLLIICTIVLLTIADHVGGHAFMQDVLYMEVMGRMEDSRLPFYFYFVNALIKYALSYPVAWLVILGVSYIIFYDKKTLPHAQLLLKLFGWMVIILLGMSIPGDKKMRYILPLIPAAALLAAYPFAFEIETKYFSFLRSALQKLFLFIPLICIVITEIVFYYGNRYDLLFSFPFLPVLIFFIAMQMLSVWQYYFYTYEDEKLWRDELNILVATLSFLVLQIFVIESIALFVNRAAEFVTVMENLRNQQHARLAFYKETPDGVAIKYVVNMPREEKPEFIDKQNDLLRVTAPTFFVTKVKNFEKLPQNLQDKFHIIGNDTLGHIPIVVFSNTRLTNNE